jgi:hypothetical protein
MNNEYYINIRTTEPTLLTLIVSPGSIKTVAKFLDVNVPEMLNSINPNLYQKFNLRITSIRPANTIAITGLKLHMGLTDDGEWIDRLVYDADTEDSNLILLDRQFHCIQ